MGVFPDISGEKAVTAINAPKIHAAERIFKSSSCVKFLCLEPIPQIVISNSACLNIILGKTVSSADPQIFIIIFQDSSNGVAHKAIF